VPNETSNDLDKTGLRSRPITREIFFHPYSDELANVPANDCETVLRNAETAPLCGNILGEGCKLARSRDQRRQAETVCVLNTAFVSLAGIAFAVWAILSDDDPSVYEHSQALTKRRSRDTVGTGRQLGIRRKHDKILIVAKLGSRMEGKEGVQYRKRTVLKAKARAGVTDVAKHSPFVD
jgi:hypothetical protein